MKFPSFLSRRIPPLLLSVVLAAAPTLAHAADVVVASLGGIWETATRECFVAPYEKQTGKKALVVLGTSAQWVNQVAANPSKPPIDLILVAPDMVIEKALDEFWTRTEKGEWEAAIQGMKQGSTPSTVLWALAKNYGGGADNIDPAFDAIKRMRAGGHMRVWNDMNEFLNLIKTGEIDIGMYWEGRTWAFHDDGNPEIGFIKPKPGVAIHSTLVQKPKNSNEEAWNFLNVMLSEPAMSCFGNRMQYGVGNAKAVYSPAVADRITKLDEILWPPYDKIAPNVRAWVERWNKEVER